jgi:hypothetical protein
LTILLCIIIGLVFLMDAIMDAIVLTRWHPPLKEPDIDQEPQPLTQAQQLAVTNLIASWQSSPRLWFQSINLPNGYSCWIQYDEHLPMEIKSIAWKDTCQCKSFVFAWNKSEMPCKTHTTLLKAITVAVEYAIRQTP